MLIQFSNPVLPVIRKTVNGADASARGAFAVGEKILYTVAVPRELGASAVVLRICREGEQDRDLPLRFDGIENGIDRYTLSLDTAEICGTEGRGLFFYEFLFLRGVNTVFTSTHNQVDFTLQPHSDRRFALTVYDKDYVTPEWFKGRIMYHIFVDRFFRGKGSVAKRSDVIMNEDWDGGIPQYAKKNGDKLANNMFFGGNLWGVAEKLEYLKSLGVGVIYLSPIFQAYSNHKYDTGNYLEVDGMFGGEAALGALLEKAKEMDIRVILDGVFNHTGSNSLYFDREGEYGGGGAYSDPQSPYRSWYCFRQYPNEYETWWGIDILPKLNPQSDACREFLVGRGGVCEKYVRMGIGGWRLDVADELSNEFLDELRETVKDASDQDVVIIGEVWENAALKEAYGKRRRYFLGGQLDSVMNYPVRNGILHYLMDSDAKFLADILKEIYATYPKCVCDSLMNLLGTHDTERILTVLGEGKDRVEGESNDTLSVKRLTSEQRARGLKLLKLAATLQYTVYGVPSVFYGDEAGLEGYHDPFCRRPYPWKNQNEDLLTFYRKLGQIRTEHSAFADGEFRVEYAEGGMLAFVREKDEERLTVLSNVGETDVAYPMEHKQVDLLTGKPYGGTVQSGEALILIEKTTPLSKKGE